MTTRTLRWLALLLVFTFFAAACGGEVDDDTGDDGDDGDSADVGDDTADDGDDTDGDDTADDGDDTDGDDAAGPNIYQDPRGGIFQEFQNSYDRGDHPFQQIDRFCVAHPAAEDRVETGPGITADTVRIGHIRSRLEDLAGLGFAVPVGDPKEMFEVFVDYVNEECGGVRGRMVELGYEEATVLGADVDGDRNRACLAMTADFHAVIVMNSTGFQGSANLCITREQETAFISTQGQTEEFMREGADRLISISITLEESLEFMVADLLASGALEGRTIGTAAPNTPGQAEAVEAGLVEPLEAAGFDVVFDIIDCAGGTICAGGIPESVTNMRNSGVDVFFNVLNVVSAPGYIAEMANQGFEPGDVQFYASDFNSQSGELVSGQITNNPDAGNLYNGAIIIDSATTGEFRDPAFTPHAFAEMCQKVYAEGNTIGAVHDWTDEGDSAWGMVNGVCSIVRVALRAIYDAGDNPTAADVHAALANLGPVDTGALTPGSISPGKTQIDDAIQTLDFVFPCDLPLPFTRDAGDPVCVTGRGDWRPAPR